MATWRPPVVAFPAPPPPAYGFMPRPEDTVRTRPSALLEALWAILPSVWFFVAGVTLGVFLAVTLVAIAPHARAESAATGDAKGKTSAASAAPKATRMAVALK